MDEKWKIEQALKIVSSYANGYVSHSGLSGGGLGQDTLMKLFRSSYSFIEKTIEEIEKTE